MDKKKLLQEKEELNRLIQNGIQFEIECPVIRKKRGFLGIPRREISLAKRKFKIEETTLSTLDRIAMESVELAIDENAIKNDNDSIRTARSLAMKHSRRMARIIAIAALGSEWEKPKVCRGGIIRYEEDTKRINELTDMFARAIKPSQLNQLCLALNAMHNLSDFLNSIRLVATDRTTMPIRIEENRMG